MFSGFTKIVEERIRRAQKKGEFDNLDGFGKPLAFNDDMCVSEDLRMAYKILKNADCLPPEIELKKEIQQAEDLLGDMQDTAEKYRAIKKLNYLILKLNSIRNISIELDMPQQYSDKVIDRLESANKRREKKKHG